MEDPMQNVIKSKIVAGSYRVTRTFSGLWVEVLRPGADPLSLDRRELAELGLLFEEEEAPATGDAPQTPEPSMRELFGDLGDALSTVQPTMDLDDEDSGDTPMMDWFCAQKTEMDN
jgi:hypothetical protein